MGGQETKLEGPDLAQGVPLADLQEGRPLAGHAHGEAVVLVRHGGEISAVGATCTHYGGPLAEGLVVGETIHCPWHHACFDLRTGANHAPALAPIACWTVERRGDHVHVLGKKDVPRPAAASGPARVAIAGAGAAGAACALALRDRGYRGAITLLGTEPPVDRPNLSKDYLAGTAPEEWIPLRGDDDWRALEVELVTDDPVTALDAGARRLTLASGRAVAAEAIVLATGAEPVRLPLPGADRPHVHLLRSLADSRAIIAAASTARRAVVIGASFIGLEVAASLRARGLDVAVVAPEKIPLAAIMGEDLGRAVRAVHEAHGTRFHLGVKPTAIDDAVTLDDGQRLPADLVVMGVGVRPRTALAERAGLRVERGILVDDHLRTSAAGIWACGDVARFPDARTGQPIRIEHWAVAARQGQAVARNLLGSPAPYHDVPFFWSIHHELTINYIGHAEHFDSIQLLGDLDARDAAVVYRLGSVVQAVATIGRDHLGLEVEAAMERGDNATLELILR